MFDPVDKTFVIGQEAITRITDALETKLTVETHLKLRFAASRGLIRTLADELIEEGKTNEEIVEECTPVIDTIVDRGRGDASLHSFLAVYLHRRTKKPLLEDAVDDAIVEEIISDVPAEELPEEVQQAYEEVQDAQAAAERAQCRYKQLLRKTLGTSYRADNLARVGRAYPAKFVSALK